MAGKGDEIYKDPASMQLLKEKWFGHIDRMLKTGKAPWKVW